MMRRKMFITVVLTLLLAPVFALAGTDAFVFDKPAPGITGTDEVVVPLVVNNTQPLMALDIPLQYSEGATLLPGDQGVTFGDRVATFEFKYANRDDANRRVVIGLISMISSDKPDLAVGSGAVAYLHFKVDPGVKEITVTPIQLSSPDHQLAYYYNDYSNGQPQVREILPEVASSVVPVTGNLPTSYGLTQNSPNPFNPTTRISFALPAAGEVKLAVFNVIGQQVKELVNSNMEAGVHEVIWDGKDANGSSVASGIYFYKIKANNFTDTKKMVLLK